MGLAQNEMKAKPALPERVRSMEGLGGSSRNVGFIRSSYEWPAKATKPVGIVRFFRASTRHCLQEQWIQR